MAFYRDLEPCSYMPFEDVSKFLAVGWLESGHSFSTGEVTEAFFDKLCRWIQDPWAPKGMPMTGGLHHCNLCQFSFSGASFYQNRRIPAQGNQHLIVPGDQVIYVIPIVIAHYVDAHRYKPPEAFIEAVLQCPEMRSIEYLKMILSNGGRDIKYQ